MNEEEPMAAGGFEATDLMPFMFWAMIIFVALYVYLYYKREDKRAKAFKAWGKQHGFRYGRGEGALANFSAAEPWGRGKRREGAHVLRGEHRGEPVLLFEYRHMGSGDSKEVFNYQVAAVPLPVSVPLLDIGQETGRTRRFGDDIDFENQAFNDKFRIESADRRFAFDVVHARTMEWMLADPRASAMPWRFEGKWLMTFEKKKLDPADALRRADFLLDARAQAPAYLWSPRP
ncbi:hypothetical protein [Glycomyces sp. NPDC048151]|uniref:hypothetical protein n=1 Tax=Glycomyces sp. NPDC048151 TaxID=3364002 RepID=UPI003716F971